MRRVAVAVVVARAGRLAAAARCHERQGAAERGHDLLDAIGQIHLHKKGSEKRRRQPLQKLRQKQKKAV